jgi:GNAT superfamily N-acetyltransferase
MLQLLDRKYAHSTRLLAETRKETAEQFAVSTCAEHPELFDAAVDLENETWDELSFLDLTAAHHACYDELLELFPEYHLCMIELGSGELVATGMCVPLHVADGAELPREGWDWVVNTAFEQGGKRANTIGALSISVPQQHRHRGLARDMINTMRALAVMNGFSRVIAPVRPSAKCQHPHVPMQNYIDWQDDRGRIFDPWLRSHVAVGGKVVGVCDRSMVVEQPLEFWKPWTGSTLEHAGQVPFSGALVPLDVDVNAGVGRYVEPNVWVTHRV